MCRRIKYLYDGGCKVCQTFKSSLEAQEGNKDRISYVNIAEDSYKPQEHNDVSYDDAMSTIHAISADGKTVKGAGFSTLETSFSIQQSG